MPVIDETPGLRSAVISPVPNRKWDGWPARPGLPDALTTVLCTLLVGGVLCWHHGWLAVAGEGDGQVGRSPILGFGSHGQGRECGPCSPFHGASLKATEGS